VAVEQGQTGQHRLTPPNQNTLQTSRFLKLTPTHATQLYQFIKTIVTVTIIALVDS